MGFEVRVPDIGDFDDVEVVEVLVAKGDRVEAEDPLISIESDKATMELPAPQAGTVDSVALSVGDRVSEGALICVLDTAAAVGDAAEASPEPAAPEAAAPEAAPVEVAPEPTSARAPEQAEQPEQERAPGERPALPPPVAPSGGSSPAIPHASPLVRKQARELGVDLSRATGSGPAGRILSDDVKGYVRDTLEGGGGGAAIEPIPAQDFARFGPVEEVPLARIRRASARNLSRAWLNVPHVTQHDEADVSDLEDYRKGLAPRAEEAGVRFSPLVFVMKAVVQALRRFPDFRSSLSPDGESLIVKDFYHLGVAVDTEQGLVVPVVRDVDQKGLIELAREVTELAERARERKLRPEEMQGAVFSISSLGGIGGTAFTPIVNAPEVAILGVSKLQVQPRWDASAGADSEGAFVPRRMLPLSLSYDHRVIDGAAAARFTSELSRVLSDPLHLLL